MHAIVYEHIITVEGLLFSNENLMNEKWGGKLTYHAQGLLIGTLNSKVNAFF